MTWPDHRDDQDHRDFRKGVRTYLEAHLPAAVTDAAAPAPERVARWRAVCGELGVGGLCIPAAYGGEAAPATYQAVVLEELGRVVAAVPMMSTAVLATSALLEADDASACERWLPRIARGELVATLAAAERPHDWDLATMDTTAVRSGAGWQVTGVKPWALDGDCAEVAFVVAGIEDGDALFAVDLDDASVRREPEATLDLTRPSAALRFDEAPAVLVGGLGRGRAITVAAHRRAAVALAAEQLGVAERTLELAVSQAGERVQFGRPIGSFQAIKHQLADRYVGIESLRAAVRVASGSLDSERNAPERLALLAHICQAIGSDVAMETAAANIHVHGAIGFTWDHVAHLYFKRATVSRQWLGTAEHHREKVAALMLDATA